MNLRFGERLGYTKLAPDHWTASCYDRPLNINYNIHALPQPDGMMNYRITLRPRNPETSANDTVVINGKVPTAQASMWTRVKNRFAPFHMPFNAPTPVLKVDHTVVNGKTNNKKPQNYFSKGEIPASIHLDAWQVMHDFNESVRTKTQPELIAAPLFFAQ